MVMYRMSFKNVWWLKLKLMNENQNLAIFKSSRDHHFVKIDS